MSRFLTRSWWNIGVIFGGGGVKIPRKRVYDLFNNAINRYLSMNIQELQEKIVGGEIEFSGLVHYDEEFLWI